MNAVLVRDDIFRRLVRARDFLHAHCTDCVRLDEVAREAFMSPFHFHRAFRLAFNETPHDYLTRLRIERAKALLRTDALPVTQVCFEVGFSSLGSFSTKFTREVGCAPSRYRNSVRTLLQMPGHHACMDVPACFVFFSRMNAPVAQPDLATAF